MKLNYSEVEQSIGRLITNDFSSELFLSVETMDDTKGITKPLVIPRKSVIASFNPFRLQIAQVSFVEIFFNARGTLEMIDDRKIPNGSGSDFDSKRKNAQKCS